MFIYKINNCKKAFTLIEVLVAVSIFLMTILALSQIFIAVIRSEKVAYALLAGENNIRNTLESMARNIRMGTNFVVDNNKIEFDYNVTDECLNAGNCDHMIYEFKQGGDIYSLQQTRRTSGGTEDINDIPMLDPSITIIYGSFEKIGDYDQQKQPTIIIRIKAFVTVRGNNYDFNVQTAVTPRIINPF